MHAIYTQAHTSCNTISHWKTQCASAYACFMKNISERLRAAMDRTDDLKSQYALSARSGVPQPTIKRILAGESLEPKQKTVSALALALGTTENWLVHGIGQMYGEQVYEMGEIEGWDDKTSLHDDDVEVPLYKEVEMAAGSGSSHSVEINGRKLRFAKSALRAAGVSPENAACATVTGNSMERLIMDGATIGIDRGRTQIKDGKIYAIDHGGMLRVKYLYRAAGGGLRLKSENDAEHPDEIYTADQVTDAIKVLGWVFWWSQIATW